MSVVKNYLSLVKFSHTIFALPFALIGFVLGLLYQQSQQPLPAHRLYVLFALVLGCMVTARSAAMAFNRWLDRRFDAANPRTAIREIPAGVISPAQALGFVLLCCAAFIAITYFINPICFYLSPVALFVILFYSYTKRFTPLCHLVLGLGLSLAPIGAFLAVTGVFHWLPILFSVAVICWVSGFDIIYALQDEQFDASQGLYSIPSVLGAARALRVSRILHVCSASAVVAAGAMASFHYLYWLAVAVFTGMLIYQQSLVSPKDLRRVNLAFMTANGIASVVFGLLSILDFHLFKSISWVG